jgi:hypothetical protein
MGDKVERKCHTTEGRSVDITEGRKQKEDRDQERDPDLLETVGEEFERTIDSGDPFESLTRTTKRFWRGLID